MPQSKSRKIAILGYRSVGEWRAPRGLLAPRGPEPRPGPGQVWGRRGHVAAARFVTGRPPSPPPPSWSGGRRRGRARGAARGTRVGGRGRTGARVGLGRAGLAATAPSAGPSTAPE